tara:strand:- start:26809 stop:27732 length:924 start_codon:yes stop_codon:yes gene_type:complete
MKIAINRSPRPGPWGGGNHFVKGFFDFCNLNSIEIVTNLGHTNIDLIFLMDPRSDSGGFNINDASQYKLHNPNCKLVQRINECDARKNTEHMDIMLLQCSQMIDHTIFVSKWMEEYFGAKGWACPSTSVQHNGVNSAYLKLRKNTKSNSDKLKIVTHHWSNNILKGFDVYDFLDYLAGKRDDIEFTYVGRHRNSFKNTHCISPLSGIELAHELLKHDIYVSGSRFDPGPNHILESLALGLPTYVHAEGGGAIEFADAGLKQSKVFGGFTELEELILNDSHFQNLYVPISWEECMTQLFSTLNELYQN